VPEDLPPWEEISSLGQGGQATVHRVRRRGETGPDYARKRLIDRSRSARFTREVETMSRLANEIPGIPRIVEQGVMGRNDSPYYVMPLYVGNLADLVVTESMPAFAARLDILVKSAVILSSVHSAGVAHRDLKPENVLIDDDGQPALADFGLCLDVAQDDEPQERLTEEWRAVGARLYIAPEMETGINSSHDHRPADFWSFGKIIWTTLTGQGPRSASDQLLAEHRLVRLDTRFGDLDLLCEQLLRRDPTERLADWSIVLTELRTVAATLTGRRAEIPEETNRDGLLAARQAARQFRSSVPAVNDQERRERYQRDQAHLDELCGAVNSGLRGQDDVLDELNHELGDLGSVTAASGAASLDELAMFGVFDDLLPLDTTGRPDRSQLRGSERAVGLVMVSVDVDGATYAALGVWLLLQGQDVWAVRVPFVFGPSDGVLATLIPPVLLPYFLHVHAPVRLGLQSSIAEMEIAGRQLVEAALEFVRHALQIVARGERIYDAAAWAEQLDEQHDAQGPSLP
jgi:tRNA A-37 threonylcarbamoyl transferase component Bud32